MFTINKLSVTTLIYLLVSQLVVAEPDISPAYFSHTAAITFNDPKAVAVTSRLPQWSYFASKHRLADLRVFNAEGIAVAHQITLIQQNTPISEFSVDAIAVPVATDIKEVVGRSANIQLDLKGQVAIHMSEIPKDVKSKPKAKITQWILDNPKLNSTAITNVRFELDEIQKSDFEAEVTIESSEDLRTWQPITSHQKLLAYFGGHRLAQLTIAMPATQARYWRIRSDDADLGRIHKIYVSTPPETVAVTEKLTVNCQLNPAKGQVLCPFNGAQLPVASVQFNFGGQRVAFNVQINTYRQVAELEKPASKQQTLQTLTAMLTSADETVIKLNGLPIEVLQLTLPQGGQLGILNAPSVTIEWPAQQLRFLAHGSSPFTLAVGADQLAKRSEQLINNDWQTVSGIILGAKEQDPQSLPQVSSKRPWLLWVLLVTAVVTLGWMAISLLRSG